MSNSQESFRDLCDNAHDLIQSVSPEGEFLYVNKIWLDTLGYNEKELKNLNVFDVIHPDSLAHCRQVMGEVMGGAPVGHIAAIFQTKDGKKIPVEGSASCRFENGKPVATRGIFRDVSERKRIEDELDRMFRLSDDLMCVAGLDGFFRHVNPAFERILEYTREELLRTQFFEFVHPDDRDKTREEIARLSRGGDPVANFENRVAAKSGKYRWFAWRSTQAQDGGIVYAIGRDITRAKRTQELMEAQAEELARSNADLEQFAYAASHDLLAPLRAIENLSEWIEEDLADSKQDKAKEHLQQLRGRVQKMRALTEDLLRYSRAGREPAEIDSIDVKRTVRELTELISPPQNITISTKDPLPRFDTNVSPFELVLRNLIENAVKHHDRTDGQIVVSCESHDDYYEFSVQDDGPGIPDEFRDKIFEMFIRIQTENRSSGTGMGLALVKRIVEGYGGWIRAEAASGRGTRFRYTWPKEIPIAEEKNANGLDS